MPRTFPALLPILTLFLALCPLPGAHAAPTPTPDPIDLAPTWTAGQRTRWTLAASQTTRTRIADPEHATDSTSAQSLRFRLTVLSTPAAPNAPVTLGVAFEELTLRLNDDSASARESPQPIADPAPPAAPSPDQSSPLAQLADVYLRCALRVEVDPSGRVTSLTGLERVREHVDDHPDLDTALGPIGPAQFARTLESLWRFDPPDAHDPPSPRTPRAPADRWSTTETITLPFLGRASQRTDWTLTARTTESAQLEAVRSLTVEPPVAAPSALSPAVAITDQRARAQLTLDLPSRQLRLLDQAAALTVTARLGEDRAATIQLASSLRIDRQPD